MSLITRLFVLSTLALAACADEGPAARGAAAGGAAAAAGGKADGPGLRRCPGQGFPAPARTKFRHTASKVMALTGARHRAQDLLVPPQEVTELAAKLTYGPTWKDLEDEDVQIYVDTCTRWLDLGTVRTDDDGVASLPVRVRLAPGVYDVRFVARGDASQTAANLWVLPAGTHVTVTDIDGTLTTSDTELWKQLFDGSYVPSAYPAAAELTRAHAERGHVVVYLTGRPSWLLERTRTWLSGRGFAAGPVHTADSNAEILPTDGSVGAYKRAWLTELAQLGYTVDLAYGNATTDIHAYAGVGIGAARQWVIGPNAGVEGTHAVTSSWTARTAEVAAGPRVVQPF